MMKANKQQQQKQNKFVLYLVWDSSNFTSGGSHFFPALSRLLHQFYLLKSSDDTDWPLHSTSAPTMEL